MYDVGVIKLAHNQRFHHEICFGLRHGHGGYSLDGDGVFFVASVFVHTLKDFAESTLAKGSVIKTQPWNSSIRFDSSRSSMQMIAIKFATILTLPK